MSDKSKVTVRIYGTDMDYVGLCDITGNISVDKTSEEDNFTDFEDNFTDFEDNVSDENNQGETIDTDNEFDVSIGETGGEDIKYTRTIYTRKNSQIRG